MKGCALQKTPYFYQIPYWPILLNQLICKIVQYVLLQKIALKLDYKLEFLVSGLV